MKLKRLTLAVALVAGLSASAAPALAFDMASFEKNLTEKTLPNGLKVFVYERPAAPVVSFVTWVSAGSAQEVPGITGIAHMFEHLAFKGTTRIGTRDYEAEKKALKKLDKAYAALEQERRKTDGGDAEDLAALEKAFKEAQESAEEHIVENEFDEIIDRSGGVGLNAGTSSDYTVYFFSLPANKVELWAYLESERFRDPVFRQFYKERDVVMEERRLRTESQPIGRLIEQFVSTAFLAHPYKQPTVGYMSDLRSLSREDANDFFQKYYVPRNMSIAIVGDVDAKKVLPIVEKYFGRLPSAPKPPPLRTVEPKQIAEKTVTIIEASQPIYVEGYHRPSARHADEAIYQAIANVLSTGRTSRLYRSLVRDKKIAAQASAFNGFPGDRHATLMLFFAIPAPGHTNDEVASAIREEIARLGTEPVSDEELQKVKTLAKANLIRSLGSNGGIGRQLTGTHSLHGDWRELFRSVERIEKVTKKDILRVAKETFVPTNRTVAMIVNEEESQ